MKNIWVKNNNSNDILCADKYKEMMECINIDLRYGNGKCSEIISNWSECFENLIINKKSKNKNLS